MSATFTTSDPCNEVMAAFAAALVALDSAVPRTAEVNTGQYSYWFTPLPELIEHVKSTLSDAGLAVSQPPIVAEGGRIGASTIFIHVVTGQWVEFPPVTLPTGNSPQAAGSAISYARRYALASVLGVASHDDDAQAAEAGVQAARAQPRQSGGQQQRTQQTANQGRQTGSQGQAPQGGQQGQQPSFRSREEAAIRTALAEQSQKVYQVVRQEFMAHFRCTLQDLPVARHGEALTYVNEAIARATAPEPDEEPF